MSNYGTGNIPLRDRVANWLCNFIMKHLATDEYYKFVCLHTLLGKKEIERILREESN